MDTGFWFRAQIKSLRPRGAMEIQSHLQVTRNRGEKSNISPHPRLGTDDRPLAFEVTSAERSRLGRPSSFLNGKERKQALNLQRCSPS